jgi:nitrous oxide reductase accessory protein NosL
MKAVRKGSGVFALALIASALISCDRIQTWIHPSQCALSGRPIHAGMGVRIQIGEKSPVRACCLRCTIAESEHTGQTIHVLSVTDYVSREQVSPQDAFFVVGSGVKPCAGARVEVPANRRESAEQTWDRCLPSIIVFARREDAEQFQAEEGGTIESFDEVVVGSKVVAGGEQPESQS